MNIRDIEKLWGDSRTMDNPDPTIYLKKSDFETIERFVKNGKWMGYKIEKAKPGRKKS